MDDTGLGIGKDQNIYETTKPGKENVLPTVKVLKIIHEAQLSHGLRHKDYQLYRQYCSRRLQRLRKNLSLVQGDRRNFKKKNVTVNMLKDERYLYIPLITIERCWAYAMQLKEDSIQEPRQKFSMRNKLKKAAKHSVAFEKLVEDSNVCDARTQLEVQGYCSWLQSSVLFELAECSHQWEKPIAFFDKSLAVYSKLKHAVSEDEVDIYEKKIQELTVKIRFCRHHLGDRSATDTLLAMRANTALGDKLDNLLLSAKERQAATLSEITWKGRILNVKHEKVRLFLLNEGLIHDEISKLTNLDERVDMLDRLLMECKDAIQITREDLKNEPTFKLRQMASSGPVSPLHFLHTYLAYHRLNLTVLRNMALADAYEKILTGEANIEDGKKTPKIPDLVRLDDLIIQNLSEILHLSGLEEDTELQREIDAQIEVHKTHRCYFIAECFLRMKKWPEALVMYEKALKHAKNANSQNLNSKTLDRLNNLLELIDKKKFTCHAQAILSLESNLDDAAKPSIQDKKMLIDRMDEYYEDCSLASANAKILELPPPMVSAPCKPLFFDLALNHIQFPSLQEQLEDKGQKAPAGGLTGLVKGLWGWGSK